MFLWDVSSYGEGMMLFAAPSVVIQRQLSWQWSAASSGLGPPSYRRPMASCKEIPPLHGKPVRIHVRFVPSWGRGRKVPSGRPLQDSGKPNCWKMTIWTGPFSIATLISNYIPEGCLNYRVKASDSWTYF